MPRRSFRDFLYDKNDIILAIVIIAAAICITVWRLGVIMDYPSTIDTEATQELIEEAETEDDTSAVTGDTEGTTDGSSDEQSQAGGTDQEPAEAATTATYEKGKLTEDVKVVVAEGEYATSVKSLVDAKVFASAKEYEAECKAAKVTATDIKPGIYTFVKDSTKSIIVQQLTK